jgi:hypothetical protein
MKRYATTLAACIGLSACTNVKPPNSTEIALANYGPAPTQEDAERHAKLFLDLSLKDPDSAKWTCDSIYKGWMQDAGWQGGKVHYGWRLDCNVNAKNSFGAYTGAKSYNFMFRDSKLDAVYGETSTSNGLGSYMEKIL